MKQAIDLLLLLGCSCLIVYGRPDAKKGQTRHLLAFVAGWTIAALIILHAMKNGITG